MAGPPSMCIHGGEYLVSDGSREQLYSVLVCFYSGLDLDLSESLRQGCLPSIRGRWKLAASGPTLQD